jgi:hypothetical protein
MVFPKFGKEITLRAKTFSAEFHAKYIMYIVKASGERSFVTGDDKAYLKAFAIRQDYRATKIVLAPKTVDKSSPFTMENRKKYWDKRRKK